MHDPIVLSRCPLVAFVPTKNAEDAKHFYRDTLQLRFVTQTPFALVFDAAGVMLRITIVPELTPAAYTVVGWQVLDISAAVRELRERGVDFKKYPGIEQDDLGIWTTPDGARIAWFTDPDGNVLSLTQSPA